MSIATVFILAQLAVAQAAPVIDEDWAQKSARPTRKEAIAVAVRESVDDVRPAAPAAWNESALRGDSAEKFKALMDDARVPDCLHPDGLKRQPTSIGPIGVVGLLALPFVAVAKLRGKCN